MVDGARQNGLSISETAYFLSHIPVSRVYTGIKKPKKTPVLQVEASCSRERSEKNGQTGLS